MSKDGKKLTKAGEMCPECRDFIIALLDARIRRVLEIDRENANDDDEGEGTCARAECFHFMEIQRIFQGLPTCGVYDDYGSPPTIEGQLFKALEVSRG